ncbi:MAG: hypothetical protein WBO04_13970 [Steroidobacteraceae bacterium]
MRIARPILLVTTPIGVAFGLREAWRLAGPGMAVLMAAMLLVVSALVWMTVRRIHHERARGETTGSSPVHEPQPGEAQRESDRIRGG